MVLTDGHLILGINAEGARLLRHRPSALVGQSFPGIWSALTQSDAADVVRRLDHVSTSREPMPHVTTRLRHGTTGSVPVEWTCQAVNQAGGHSLLISLRDLSREEGLREERDRLAAIAEETPSPVIELDQYGQMLYANPAMTAWLAKLGYRADGLPRILPHNLSQLVGECLRSGNTMHGRDVFLPEASFTWTFCPVTTHGLVRGYALDMTTIHEAQQELRRTAAQLQESNRQLDEALTTAQESVRTKAAFLATMSHELRTPMNGVIGMTSLLMETTLSAEQQSYTETIRQCGESLLHLINDVLECSKIEAGKLELERIDFNLRTAVEEVLAQFAGRAETKGLELTGLVHATVPTALEGDPGRLRQVLTNLVGNALKFTERGEVSLQAFLEQETQEAAVIRFEVTDSGIGIAPEATSKLFQPFMQADSSTTRKYGGTGLGLSISKQLVELMGGRIGVKSEPGRGSTFWCTARFTKQAGSPLAILPSNDLEGRRILIVDDNESNRMILHHLVTGWGMIDDVAKDAEEALQRVREAAARGISYDLAILDVIMPGKDGLQLAREFRRDPAGAGMRIVVLTSLLQRGHAEQARQAGAMGYLPKPVCHDQLRECLRTVLGIAREIAPEPGYLAPATPQLVTRHTLADHRPRQRILIVEDNLINQKLAVRMAEKLGYQAFVAENGEEALKAMETEDFAVVIMDCQMPVMDGFEATRRIRDNEQRQSSIDNRQSTEPDADRLTNDESRMTASPHIPIIAVTANAMQGDREHCLAAGMDDYLAKPIQMETLRAVLHRWAAPSMARGTVSDLPAQDHNSARGVFDPASMFRNIGEDNHLFAQLVELFLDQYPAMLANIKEGLIQADSVAVERTAHSLKGTAGNLCAPEVVLAASRLEALGHLGALQDAPLIYAHLEQEVLRLVQALGPFRQGYPPIMQAA
jgi:signal transduction histidine kinase/CheY-like chemotaxis protein/HPt (histidine-containing phosphotransfer) domain-containing protein